MTRRSSSTVAAASGQPWPPTTCRRWATPRSSPWTAACAPGARRDTRLKAAIIRRAEPSPSLATVRQAIVDCEDCPRLRRYCQGVAREKKAAHRDETYWGRPVPGFGDPDARLLLVGLAPAAHGANRTGRVFTGDGSGDFLFGALHAT